MHFYELISLGPRGGNSAFLQRHHYPVQNLLAWSGYVICDEHRKWMFQSKLAIVAAWTLISIYNHIMEFQPRTTTSADDRYLSIRARRNRNATAAEPRFSLTDVRKFGIKVNRALKA
ncbi:hypothetical protein TNCV_2594951 [Trichonephila clavipes]|nr:hypothetical protein TNCV_2594951 [Trichonephila clavipes]